MFLTNFNNSVSLSHWHLQFAGFIVCFPNRVIHCCIFQIKFTCSLISLSLYMLLSYCLQLACEIYNSFSLETMVQLFWSFLFPFFMLSVIIFNFLLLSNSLFLILFSWFLLRGPVCPPNYLSTDPSYGRNDIYHVTCPFLFLNIPPHVDISGLVFHSPLKFILIQLWFGVSISCCFYPWL